VPTDDHLPRKGKAPTSGVTTPGRAGRGRAVVDFRPYPTAPTRTRRSPANSTRPGSRRANHPSTPSTIWFTPTVRDSPSTGDPVLAPAPSGGLAPIPAVGRGAEPSPPTWSLSVVTRAVTSFTAPGATVLLVPWPHPRRSARGATVPAAAVAALTELGRRPRVGHLPQRPVHGESDDRRPDGIGQDRADLLITVMPARRDAAEHTDAVARLAARSLRLGGVLAVLTHCDRTGEVLIDPTGPMVTAGQDADLLYLQHIVAVHLPPSDPRIRSARGPERTAGGRVTQPHLRVHSDVLIFTQPHDDTAGRHDVHPSRP